MFEIMTLDLTDDEAPVIAMHLRRAIDEDPFRQAPRLDVLKFHLGVHEGVVVANDRKANRLVGRSRPTRSPSACR
jgi:hypothetical protein